MFASASLGYLPPGTIIEKLNRLNPNFLHAGVEK